MANGVGGGFSAAINSLPRSVVLGIQFIGAGILIGIWWAGNQSQISQITTLKESIDKLRGEMQTSLVTTREHEFLKDEVDWRFKRVEKRLGLEHVDIR